MWTAAAAAAKSLQSCLTLCDPIDGSPPGSCPRDSPDKNTGVGCHFLLQCMKVKRESEVTLSRPTLCDPMDCSLPGSSVHGVFQARALEWGAIAFSGYLNYHDLNILESESCSVVFASLQPHGLYSPWNSPGQDTGMGSLSLLQGIFPTQAH